MSINTNPHNLEMNYVSFGLKAEPDKCIPYFQEWIKCDTSHHFPRNICMPQFSDYFECRSGSKQVRFLGFIGKTNQKIDEDGPDS
jgi:hypothetical protein